MAVATYVLTNINAGWTQTSLCDAIRTQLIAAGWDTVVFDDYSVSGERNLIFRLIHNAGVAFGTTFLRIQCSTALAWTLTIGTGWNTGTKAMTNPSTAVAYSAFVTTSPIRIHMFNAWPEFSGIYLEQTGTFRPFFVLFPSEIMPGWDLNAWPGALIPVDATFATWRMSGASPYGVTAFPSGLNNTNMANTNQITNRRDSVGGVLIFCPNTQGVFARTSDDLGQGCASGLNVLNELLDDSFSPARRHSILSATAGGLTVRIS